MRSLWCRAGGVRHGQWFLGSVAGYTLSRSAQPKRSAAPLFGRMLASHDKALGRAREKGEPAGRLAARELEVQRMSGDLRRAGDPRRAGDLDDDVGAAIEAA